MSGQLLGAAAGATLGFVIGGPMGAQIGWAAGSVIGGILDPQRVDGPHLADRKVQVSTYGAAIPILYGGTAGAGNVIWSTDLVEHDVESEGKGTVTTSHTYTVSCAVLIGEGPLGGLRRIWADAKLVYDVSDSADAVAQAASAEFAQFFTFYQGTEDQLPDPTIEAALGAGNVPAYRGRSYVVFTDLPLEDYGNRIPNFKFEVGGELVEELVGGETVLTPLIVGPWDLAVDRPIHSLDSAGEKYQNYAQTYTWYDYDTARTENAALYSGSTAEYSDKFIAYSTPLNTIASVFPDGAFIGDADVEYVLYFMAPGYPDEVVNLASSSLGYPHSSTWCGPMYIAGATPGDGTKYWTRDSHIFTNGASDYLVQLHKYGEGPSSGPYSQGVNNCTNYPPEAAHFPIAKGQKFIALRVKREPAPPPDQPGCQIGDPCVLGKAQLPGNPDYCISCDGTVTPNNGIAYTVISGTYKQLVGVMYSGDVLVQNALGPVLEIGDPDYNNSAFWSDAAADAMADGALNPAYWSGFPTVVSSVAQGVRAGWMTRLSAEGFADLADIVADICTRAGMPTGSPGTFDVSELAGIEVQGFAIARQMPARQAILSLQQAFWWDFVESGRQIKAVLRGASSVATIGLDDMGASESGGAPVAVVPTRGQEAELPATVSVSYPSRAAGYETATQRARRVVTGSNQTMAVEMPVVMTDQRAANVAEVLLYSTWTNRTERAWSTTRKFAKYEPTDVLTLDDGEFIFLVRVTDRSESGGVITWRGVDELPAGYSPNATPGNAAGNTVREISFDGPTNLMLLDCPIASPDHDDPGHYAAAAGYRSSWPGATALRSRDGGSSYATVQSMSSRATLGYAQTALADWAGANMVDEAATVEVLLHAGTLSSISTAQLLDGANLALLGDEWLQFRTATLIDTNTWRLSGLLRGRFGTEQHMGTHAINDRFVLFNASVYRIYGSLSELDVAGSWKGVTFGQSADAVTAQDFTNTGVGLKPLSPVHLYGTSIGGGEYRLNWVRRTRVDGKWRDLEVPLGEDTESYDVLVIRGGTQISSETASSTTLDVTAIAGDVVEVYQLSSQVGRGFPASITLT